MFSYCHIVALITGTSCNLYDHGTTLEISRFDQRNESALLKFSKDSSWREYGSYREHYDLGTEVSNYIQSSSQSRKIRLVSSKHTVLSLTSASHSTEKSFSDVSKAFSFGMRRVHRSTKIYSR